MIAVSVRPKPITPKDTPAVPRKIIDARSASTPPNHMIIRRPSKGLCASAISAFHTASPSTFGPTAATTSSYGDEGSRATVEAVTQEAIYRWTYRSFAVVSLIVVVSGVLLVFFYRPTAGASDNVLQSLHLVTTWAWLAMLVAIVALEFGRRSVVSAGALLVNLGIVAGVAFTGYLLPWDQLALNAITVGTDIEGFTPVVGRGNDCLLYTSPSPRDRG